MDFSRRTAGVLLPVSALPGGHPCGSYGRAARRFIDALATSGASTWQVLPLGPTRAHDDHSPYSATCSFSLSTDLISQEDIDEFVDHATTPAPRATAIVSKHESTQMAHADRDRARAVSERALASGFERFRDDSLRMEDFAAFCAREHGWLHDAARFAALTTSFGNLPWWTWPPPLRERDPPTLRDADATHHEAMELHKFGQFVAHEIWADTRAYALESGVRIMGDLPIYVHADGPDVWSHPDLFDVEFNAGPTHFAGVPPDAFSTTGQLWRNPTYRWDASAATEHEWWRRRIARQMALFDDLRLDHFRGFHAFWRVSADAHDATSGQWVQGPGADLLAPIVDTFGADRFLAEDLGLIDEPVESLRQALNLPSTRVLQFATEDTPTTPRHAPDSWPSRSVAYTGTHDNPTLCQWLEGLHADTLDELRRRLKISEAPCTHEHLLARTFDSAAALVVVPLPDLLALKHEGRINTPGVEQGNWRLRISDAQIQAALAETLAPALIRHGRQR